MKLIVAADEQGRVDKVLAKHYPAAGRRQLAELFEAGEVKLRGKKAKKGDFVSPGDEIELAREPVSGDALRPQPDPAIALEVLLETPDIIVVNKPAGMPSQPLRAGELGTVANAIVARWPECAAIGDDPRDGGLVHRLDIGTSGVLVAARTAEAYRRLREAFGKGDVQKHYLAIVEGVPSVNEIEAPLSQRGDHVAVDHNDGLTAVTTLHPLESSGSYSLVRCFAKTGRMHQVRAHLAFAGSPIAGDTLYRGTPLAEHPGFFLHAHEITLPDALHVTAPIPARFHAAASAVGLTAQ
ncbi:MAG TPA: RluA family pseudouridine synthase [Kofleriaceae bacterium]|nr:RluA family pseudouridine synthase [Kofleriaceae bacterium]